MSPSQDLSDTTFHRQWRLRDFSRRVAQIQSLNEDGELGVETSFLMIRKLWNELQQLQPVRPPRRVARPGA